MEFHVLTTTIDMLRKAQEGGYAVGHFNTRNLEFSQGIIDAAVEMSSPVIVAISIKSLEHGGVAALARIVKELAAEAPVPVALHLDHGPDYAWAERCVAHGFSSIMIDASSKPYGENVRMTKDVVQLCHAAGIPVEAELGQLKGVEDWVNATDHVFTDPAVALDFVNQSQCDSLAVAIGTSHGAYKFKGGSKLDFERLKKIREVVSVPLVLHGASMVPQDLLAKAKQFGAKLEDAAGVSEEDIKTAISLGICKVNTDTDLRLAFTAAGREFYEQNRENFDPISFLAHTRNAIKEHVKRHITLFGSAGKA